VTDSVELTIESVAAGGDGVGRREGIVVFVPRTAPGDRVRARLDLRRRFARGRLEEVLVPSAVRIEPPCAHYRVDRCGGCQLQHVRYGTQLDIKSGIVRDALTRLGKRAVDAPVVVSSEQQWRYRRKLTLAMRRRRAGAWVIGLHSFDDAGRVFQLEDCPITDERVMAIWREVMAATAFFPDENELRASLRLLDDGAAMVMEGGRAWSRRQSFFKQVSTLTALWWKPTGGARSLVAARGDSVAGASFAQVNPGVATLLHAHVLERARAHAPSSVVDAYAGAGATAVPLAADGATVTAIELDREASDRCAAQLPEGSRAIAGRVEDLLPSVLPTDVVLVNPPRSGMHERVAGALENVSTPPRAVIYVSCDPATLARDLTRLSRYRIASLRSFDMFPQTAHVETVCELVPDGDAA